jgi:uncharacterized protein (TIGR03437 family)
MLSPTKSLPTVTIGGKAALVLFAGLVPDTIGEYQVNVKVPDDVTTGDAVSLLLSIGGAVSNTVTIAVR